MGAIKQTLTDVRALCRSLKIYRFDREHSQALYDFYRSFVKPGNLVFDVGAHAGDRTACFRRLGARVVSIEPQTLFARFLKLNYLLDDSVKVLRCVVADSPGFRTLMVNSENPTVSTLSQAFVSAAQDKVAPGWEGQQWDRQAEVHTCTLDQLITEHGIPDFVKIDVEGAETDVLRGLSRPLPALSFEFTTLQREISYDCIDRCVALDMPRFNISMRETQQWKMSTWTDADSMKRFIAALPPDANSGDVYAASAA